MAFFQELAGDVSELVGDYVAAGGIRASVKTNLGPELPIYSGSAPGERTLLETLGVRSALIVRDRRGNVLATYGEPPATDPLLVAGFALATAVAVVLTIRAIRSF